MKNIILYSWSKVLVCKLLILICLTLTNMSLLWDKTHAAQIYSYDFDNYNQIQSVYHDQSLASNENKCLNGLLNRMVQIGNKETIEACLNTFGYNPENKIKSPVMIVFEIGETSPEVTTTIIYKSKNNQINRESFSAVGARYYQWHPPHGIYTLDYIKRDNSSSFKPAYGNFYSPRGQKDKNGNAVNFGFHGREGNLMAGKGSNGCYRHQVSHMNRMMTIIRNAGKEINLPSNWFENNLPIAVISKQK
ncbi:MAG: L,D-transpeptidase [Cyanobacteriota bacterium]|nr:L,D-transpeptidase [Cyanobacteriota bacterium]